MEKRMESVTLEGEISFCLGAKKLSYESVKCVDFAFIYHRFFLILFRRDYLNHMLLFPNTQKGKGGGRKSCNIIN